MSMKDARSGQWEDLDGAGRRVHSGDRVLPTFRHPGGAVRPNACQVGSWKAPTAATHQNNSSGVLRRPASSRTRPQLRGRTGNKMPRFHGIVEVIRGGGDKRRFRKPRPSKRDRRFESVPSSGESIANLHVPVLTPSRPSSSPRFLRSSVAVEQSSAAGGFCVPARVL
jgi:hypothetical protein